MQSSAASAQVSPDGGCRTKSAEDGPAVQNKTPSVSAAGPGSGFPGPNPTHTPSDHPGARDYLSHVRHVGLQAALSFSPNSGPGDQVASSPGTTCASGMVSLSEVSSPTYLTYRMTLTVLKLICLHIL